MKFFHLILCIGVLALLFTGCQSTRFSAMETSAPTITPNAASVESSVPATVSTAPMYVISGGQIPFENPGSLRISYTGNRSSVQYITDVSQLPNHAEFHSYDAAFFKDHALLLVTDTVGSGSTQISIDSVIVDGSTASITLRRTTQGDVGTADMASWFLWVTVPTGLDFNWEVANPAYENSTNTQTH